MVIITVNKPGSLCGACNIVAAGGDTSDLTSSYVCLPSYDMLFHDIIDACCGRMRSCVAGILLRRYQPRKPPCDI